MFSSLKSLEQNGIDSLFEWLHTIEQDKRHAHIW